MEEKSTKRGRRMVRRPLEPEYRKAVKYEYLNNGNKMTANGVSENPLRKNFCLWRVHYKRNVCRDRVTLRQFFSDRSFDIDRERNIGQVIRIKTQPLIKKEWLRNNTKERYHWRNFTNKVCTNLMFLMIDLWMDDMLEFNNVLIFNSANDNDKIDRMYEIGIFDIPYKKSLTRSKVRMQILEYNVRSINAKRNRFVADMYTNWPYVTKIIRSKKQGSKYENIHVQKRLAAYKGYYRTNRRGRKRAAVEKTDKQSSRRILLAGKPIRKIR